MQLTEFYNRVLQMGLLKADDEGVIRLSEEHSPALMIDDAVVVLPTKDQIKNLTEDKKVFHPLAEDTIFGLSDVALKLLERLNFALNVLTCQMLVTLYTIANASSVKQIQSTAQLEYLKQIATTPKKPIDILKFVSKHLEKEPTRAFVEILLTRGGNARLHGERVSRLAIVTFPMYRALQKDLQKTRKDSEFDLSADQVQHLIELFQALIPNIDLEEEYNAGVGVRYAPFLTVMLKAAGGLHQVLANFKRTFKDVLDLGDEDDFDQDYSFLSILDDQDKLKSLANQYPNLDLKQNPIEKDVIRSTTTAPATVSPAVVLQAAPTPAAPESKREQTYAEWAAGRVTPSSMGAIGFQREQIKRHNEGYANYFNSHVAAYGTPPPGFPHPSQIPEGQMAPMYPGAAGAPPMMPNATPMMPMGMPSPMTPGMMAPPMGQYPMAPMMPPMGMAPMMPGMGQYPMGMYPNPLSAAGGYRR